jgi:hypothetical protein
VPHKPTPPEGRKPPTSIIPAVVVSRISRSCTFRRKWRFRVRAKTTNEPSETAK